MRIFRWLLGALGLGIMLYAFWGMFTGPGTAPGPQLLFLAVLVLLHDGVILPMMIIIGFLVGRRVPGWARTAVLGGLVASVTLVAIAVPDLVKAHSFPDNPSLLPRDYWLGLLIALAVCWLVVAAIALWTRRGRPRPHPRWPRPAGPA